MKKVLLLLFIMNISVFSKVINTAVILENNSEISNIYLKSLKDELVKNFAGTELEPKVSKILYLNNGDSKEIMNTVNLDKEIDGVFILTNTSIDEIKSLNKNKFYSMPLGFGKSLKVLPNNLNYIYSNLDLKNYLEIFKEVDGVNEIDVFISNISDENLKI